MEDNEKNEYLDTQEESNKENEEELDETKESNEDEESTDEEDSSDTSSSPSLEDYEAMEKKVKTLQAQKEHWRKTATLKPKEKQENIENNNNDYLTRDEAILLTKGYDEDDITQLKRLAGNNKLIEASNDPLFLSYKKEKERKEKASKAQLSSSNKPLGSNKPISEMSDKEHKEYFYKTLKNR